MATDKVVSTTTRAIPGRAASRWGALRRPELLRCPEGAKYSSQGQRPWTRYNELKPLAPTGRDNSRNNCPRPLSAAIDAWDFAPLGLRNEGGGRYPGALPLAVLLRPFGASH